MGKNCHKCKIEKPINEFHKHGGNKDGHSTICKSCVLLRHKEKRLEYRVTHEKWIANNKEHWKEYEREYNKEYRQRPEFKKQNKSYQKKYYHTERGRIVCNLKTARRRKRERHLINDITPNQVLQIKEDQQNKCNICHKKFDEKLPYELDHIIPVSKSKPGDPGLTYGNVQLLCRSCNAVKNNKA